MPGVLGNVDLHHGEYSYNPPWSIIEVYGCAPTPAIHAAVAEHGARIATGFADHFETQR